MCLDRLDFQGQRFPLNRRAGGGSHGFRGFPVGSGCGLVIKEVKEGRKFLCLQYAIQRIYLLVFSIISNSAAVLTYLYLITLHGVLYA
jgi:hypothetical protein